MEQSLLDIKMKINKYSDLELAEVAENWIADARAGADLSEEDKRYINALQEEIISRFIKRELIATVKIEKAVEELKQINKLAVAIDAQLVNNADFIYRDLPFEDIDFAKIEQALGFKLFIWQKTYISRGYFRQYGATTAQILKRLLTDKEPIDLTERAKSHREQIEREELIKIYQKLQAAGVETCKVFFTRKDKAEYAKSK